MQSSLGIFIEKNIVKYAKLQKDKDVLKIESYNTAFYDNNLSEVISKIVSETYSYKTPISINVSDEIYNTSTVSALLSAKDLKKAIDIDFEILCSERGYNKSSVAHKYLIADLNDNPDNKRVLGIIVNKLELEKSLEAFAGSKVGTIAPISVSIGNLVETSGKQNIAILNIEDKTQMTTILDGQICQIDNIDIGMAQIISEINKTENSISKAYEVCKNMTIYTQGASELYTESSEYIGVVTDTLYSIINEVKRIISGFFFNIDKIYITGAGTCINNIDLFFQEFIQTTKCELLKPYFVNEASSQIPVKEYMEVNSAIALALDGLGMINQEVNFGKGVKSSNKASAKDTLSQDVTLTKIRNIIVNFGRKIANDFASPLESFEKLLVRLNIACVITIIMFTLFSNAISNKIDKKSEEVETAIAASNKEIAKLDNDISIISSRGQTYNSLISEITEEPEKENSKDNERVIAKDAIPNMLNRIMFVIPKKVKIVSITNTTSSHIQIVAEAEKYEQLGYFKAVLTTNEILKDVKSTSAEKVDSALRVTIEGDLP